VNKKLRAGIITLPNNGDYIIIYLEFSEFYANEAKMVAKHKAALNELYNEMEARHKAAMAEMYNEMEAKHIAGLAAMVGKHNALRRGTLQ